MENDLSNSPKPSSISRAGVANGLTRGVTVRVHGARQFTPSTVVGSSESETTSLVEDVGLPDGLSFCFPRSLRARLPGSFVPVDNFTFAFVIECAERLESERGREGMRAMAASVSSFRFRGELDGPATEAGVLGVGSRSPTDP